MVGGGNYSHIARVLLSAPKQTKNDKKKSQLFKKLIYGKLTYPRTLLPLYNT